MDKQLRAHLEGVYQLPATELDTLESITDEKAMFQAIEAIDASRVNKLREPIQGKFDEGKKAGFKEGRESLETVARQLIPDLPKGVFGEDLIKAIPTVLADKNKLDESAIKTHPVYLALETEKDNTAKEWEGKLNTYKSQVEKDQQFKNSLQTIVNPVFSKCGYVIPDEPFYADSARNEFEKRMSNYEFRQPEGGGQPIPWDVAQNKRAEDSNGRLKTVEQIVSEAATGLYKMASNNGGASPQNGNAGNNGGAGAGAKKFANEAELATYMKDETIDVVDRDNAYREFVSAKSQ